MKKPKQFLVTERLSSIYPDELNLTNEQAFQAFGIEVRPEFQDLRLEFDVESSWGGNSYTLSLFGSRPETLQETAIREAKSAKIIASQNLEKQKREELERKTLARLKKKYEK